jgi:hypothetical protein
MYYPDEVRELNALSSSVGRWLRRLRRLDTYRL